MNELSGKAKYADAWEAWKAENWDDTAKMTKAEAEAQQRIREIETENETLRQLQGDSDVTFEQLQSEVDKMVSSKLKGALTEEQFNQKYGSKLFDKDAYDKEINQRVTNWTAALDDMYFCKLYELGFKNKDEFGEILKPVDVIKYANENKIQDLEEAYNRMVSPRRTEKQNKDMEVKLEAARKEGEIKGKQEAMMGVNGKMPTDSGAPEMSHLQERLLRQKDADAKPAIAEEIKLDGSGKLGHAVADIYRKQKAGEGTGITSGVRRYFFKPGLKCLGLKALVEVLPRKYGVKTKDMARLFSFEMSKRNLHQVGVVQKLAESSVAHIAQEPTDLASDMAVIDNKVFSPTVPASPGFFADGTRRLAWRTGHSIP